MPHKDLKQSPTPIAYTRTYQKDGMGMTGVGKTDSKYM